MSLETDLLLDRRRLKRRLLFWRGLAFVAVLAAILVAFGRYGAGTRYIARVNVDGIITEDRKLTRAIAALGRDARVSAVIVYVDSPGGSVAGGATLHDAIAKLAARKPVVAVMGGIAASAGYMVTLPAARIFANAATLTGSIGVLLQTVEFGGLLGRAGIDAEAITSGPLKDQPSFTRPLTPEGRDVLHGLVMDMYDQFVTMVAEGRHLDPARVRELADGRAYTGRQAVGLGLVDQLGGEQDAVAWLASNRGVDASLPIRDLSIGSFAERALGASSNLVLEVAQKIFLSQRLKLDGPWALWQPSQP
jgi:protease IV